MHTRFFFVSKHLLCDTVLAREKKKKEQKTQLEELKTLEKTFKCMKSFLEKRNRMTFKVEPLRSSSYP